MNESEPDDESAHLLPRDCDVTVTSRGAEGRKRSTSASGSCPTDVTPRGPGSNTPGRSLSSEAKRLSVDDGSAATDSRATLLGHRPTLSRAGSYGTLDHSVHRKLSTLHRLGYAEVVERITLTWENIDVYVPLARSKPLVLRGLRASAASTDSVQPKHILKDGKKRIHLFHLAIDV